MKTTSIRLIHSNNFSYNFLEIQFLTESYANGLMGTFSTIGSVTFQQNKGEDKWYGLSYKIDTPYFGELDCFHRIAKAIKKKVSYDSQPEDVIKFINGREFYLFNQEFFLVSDKGKRCYMVVCNGDNYGRLVAKNQKDAENRLSIFVNNRRTNNYVFTLGDYFLIE